VIIADTNVVSELMRDRPDPEVLAWAGTLDQGDVTISVITVEEVERGLTRLPVGRRRRTLTDRWHQLLDAYADTVLVYDVPAARATAAVLVHREKAGRPIALADAEIAGTCVSQGADLATRNTADFADIPHLVLVDPFA
jgi:predicted nucleic acid-binding protein